MTKKSKRDKNPDPLSSLPIQEVVRQLGLRDCDWDIVLVGDGSATTWSRGCGYSVTLITRCGFRKVFWGGFSVGSIDFAETAPYFFALSWYEEEHGKVKHRIGRSLRVHIITDSSATADKGNRTTSTKTSKALWASIRWFEDNGYCLYWHWIGRSRLALNVLSDYLAGATRKQIEEITLPNNSDIYMYNPPEIPEESPYDC